MDPEEARDMLPILIGVCLVNVTHLAQNVAEKYSDMYHVVVA